MLTITCASGEHGSAIDVNWSSWLRSISAIVEASTVDASVLVIHATVCYAVQLTKIWLDVLNTISRTLSVLSNCDVWVNSYLTPLRTTQRPYELYMSRLSNVYQCCRLPNSCNSNKLHHVQRVNGFMCLY